MKLLRWVGVAFVLLGLCACDTGQDVEEDFSKAPLPMANANSNSLCTEQDTPPSFEAWAGAADAIVFGTLIEVAPLLEPAWVARSNADPPFVDTDECTGNIEAGLHLVLSDLEVLRGQAPSAPMEITLGTGFVFEMAPMPLCLDGKSITWVPRDMPGRIAVGQRIGGALFQDPDWGLWGPQKGCGVFLWIDQEQTVRVQESGNLFCCAPTPEGLDGLSLAEFRALVDDLDLSDPAVQEEIAQRRIWGNDSLSRLEQYWGATCFPGPECQRDSDCDPGLLCRDGFCGPECGFDADCGPGELCVDGKCEEQ